MWQLRGPAFAASLRKSCPRTTLTFSSTCSSSKFLFPHRASLGFASLLSLVERQSAPMIPSAEGSEDPVASPRYKGRLPPTGGDLLRSGDTVRSRARSSLEKGLLTSLSCGERLHLSSHQSPSRSLRRGRSPCFAASPPRLRLPPELLPTERLVPAVPHQREAGLGLPAPRSLRPADEEPPLPLKRYSFQLRSPMCRVSRLRLRPSASPLKRSPFTLWSPMCFASRLRLRPSAFPLKRYSSQLRSPMCFVSRLRLRPSASPLRRYSFTLLPPMCFMSRLRLRPSAFPSALSGPGDGPAPAPASSRSP